MTEKAGAAALRLESTAFGNGRAIPAKHTADGADVSPALSWCGAPPATRSFALVCEDPDAPRGNWVHWVVYDIPAAVDGLPEGVAPTPTLAAGGAQGKNDFGKIGWGGPAPPSGTHRYFFRLYASDRTLGLPPGATAAEVRRAIEERVVARGELMGTYSRR
jgi:hypothetical protein